MKGARIKEFEKLLYGSKSPFKTEEEISVAKSILDAAKDQYNTITRFLEQTKKAAEKFKDVIKY